MFHNRTLNNSINRTHKRALRIVYRDKTSNFADLLQKGNAVTVRQRYLQALATEVYKLKMGLVPKLVKNLFPHSTQACNLRSTYEYKHAYIEMIYYSTESFSFFRS